jgi:UDP-N-acetyl-2-amino-2-deoxyglucuronate dehydrogenase
MAVDADRAPPGRRGVRALPAGPIGFALLGAGAGAGAHAEALATLPGARLVAVVDPDLGRARRLALPHGAEAADAPEAALARRDVQAACIVAPNHAHVALAGAAAAHGVAVLVEKPVGRDAGEAEAIVASCDTAGVPIGVVLQSRFAPEAIALRERIQAGGLGRLVGAVALVRDHRDAGYFEAGPWRGRRDRSGGGVLRVQAIHTVDLLEWLLGPVVRVTAATATRRHAVEVEDVVSASLELADGIPAALFATTAAPVESPTRIEIFGTEGWAVLLEARAAVRAWHGPPGPEALRAVAALDAEMAARLDRPWPHGTTPELHRALLAAFVLSLRTGRAPAPGGPAAVRIQRVLDTIYAAAREGARMTVAD